MADYAATASAVYDPQQQSEAAQLASARDQNLESLKEQESSIDPYYNDAIKQAGTDRSAAGAKQDLIYSTALSGQGSGLLANQQRLLDQDLQQTDSKLTSEEATKHDNINSQRSLVGNNYTTGMSALAAKYAGLKSSYIADAQARDADIARQEQWRNEDKAFQTSQNAASAALQERLTNLQLNANKPAAPTRADYNGDLDNVVAQLDKYRASGYKGAPPTTSTTIASQLAQKYQGIVSPQEINSYLKTLFNKYGLELPNKK